MAELPEEKKEENQVPQKKALKIGKIIVDRNLCIGAASCIAVAPGCLSLIRKTRR